MNSENLHDYLIFQRLGDLSINSDPINIKGSGFSKKFNQTFDLLEEEKKVKVGEIKIEWIQVICSFITLYLMGVHVNKAKALSSWCFGLD